MLLLNPTVGAVVTFVGAVIFLVAGYAESYHASRFQTHITTLEAQKARLERDDPDVDDIAEEVNQELVEFHNDPWVDRSARVMQWGHPIGMGLVTAGAILLLWA